MHARTHHTQTHAPKVRDPQVPFSIKDEVLRLEVAAGKEEA